MQQDWISITEAARRLTAAGDRIDRSSLSRYVKQHSEALPTKREGRSNLVEFGVLARHRSENVRVDVRLEQPAGGGSGAPAAEGGQRFSRTQSDGAARKAMADAELREMDLAERRGKLTVTAEVDRAGREALVLMRTAFERAVETEAASLAVRYGWDERIVRLALKSFARAGVERFHQEMMKRLDAIHRRRDAGETRPTSTEADALALQ